MYECIVISYCDVIEFYFYILKIKLKLHILKNERVKSSI